MLLGCVSILGPEDEAVVPFYSYDAYRINAAKSDAFLYSPTTGALFERGVELPTRIECCGPGAEILFELDLRSRTMSISINSRIQSVTFNDVATGVRSHITFSHYFLTLNNTLHVCRYDRASSSRTVQMHTHNKPFGSRVYNGKVLFLVQAPRSQVACLVLNVRVLQMIFVRFVTARVSPALLVCN